MNSQKHCFCAYSCYTFHVVYTREVQKESDDAWLRSQCMEPEFYLKMRQHTDLCAQVQENHRESKILKALLAVGTATHLCGSRPCFIVVQDFVNSRAFVWICIIVCAALYAAAWILQSLMFYKHDRSGYKHFSGMPTHTWQPANVTELQYLNDGHSDLASSTIRNRRQLVDTMYNSNILRLM
jgi:hypothetical protein